MYAATLFLTPLALALAHDVEDSAAKPSFAAPAQLTRGGENFTGIYYPSPVLHDVVGDGAPELVIGDLPGYVIYCERGAQDAPHAWSASKRLESNGAPIKLDNW